MDGFGLYSSVNESSLQRPFCSPVLSCEVEDLGADKEVGEIFGGCGAGLGAAGDASSPDVNWLHPRLDIVRIQIPRAVLWMVEV